MELLKKFALWPVMTGYRPAIILTIAGQVYKEKSNDYLY